MKFDPQKDLNDSFNALKTGWHLGKMVMTWRRKRAERRRVERETRHTQETGLPSPETAMGRKAREVAKAEEDKLKAPPPIHGAARWGTVVDAATMVGEKPGRELFLGFLMENGQDTPTPLVARYPGHLLTVAGTGQGKSATQIVFNLLTYTGSVVVIDPKGELYDLTAQRRRQFGKVFRLAPLARPSDPPSDRYNPLDELGDPRELGNRARRLAEMLMVRQSDKGGGDGAYFENEGINLLTAIIMGVVELTEDPAARARRTLAEVRRICSLPLLGDREQRDAKTEYFEDVLVLLAQAGKSRLVRQQCGLFAGYTAKQLASFISEINSNLAFFDGHVGFEEATASSDFKFEDLAKQPTTVYLTIPLKDIGTSFRFLRAMIGQAFSALEEQRDATEASVLFILDEFPALKDMPFMREAVAQMRSAGAWFWFFVQDVAQLEAVYGRWAGVFLSQTDYQVFFGAVNDGETKKHISTALGVGTYAYRDAQLNWGYTVGQTTNDNSSPMPGGSQGDGRNVGQSVNINTPVVLNAKPLLTPFEVGTCLGERRPGETHPSTSIIFAKQAGGYPLMARRVHWRTMFPVVPVAQPVTPQQSTGTGPVRS